MLSPRKLPTAKQNVALAHETSVSWPPHFGLFGLGTIDHAFPFQRSASVSEVSFLDLGV